MPDKTPDTLPGAGIDVQPGPGSATRDDGDPGVATFQFQDEDHTLGNSIRHMLMRHPDVEFAAYHVLHPSEPVMNVRVEVREGTTTAEAAMLESLDNLSRVCDHMLDTFDRAVQEHSRGLPKDAGGRLARELREAQALDKAPTADQKSPLG
ncbi:unnamed protein product [Prorocentrum cordatum]|uniref:DNA-directed RNA polymerase RBP11-like dimerisation domain-containing protein n=1 Tax=Prorocentrum cordatum TaxID=2364126 RepID=A0ABN9SVP7_9DINO|nr:unnamed protein product [Polarella glacialis]